MAQTTAQATAPTCDETRVRERYRELTLLLIERGLTFTAMESATGGQIASLVTDTEGSSAVFKGSFVTYSNEAKVMQGVPAEVIERYTVYSEQTAAAMAEAARDAYGADVAVGVTGTMGNADPANPGASVPGEVYFAVALRDGAAPGGAGRAGGSGETATRAYHVSLAPQPTRLAYKLAVAEEVRRRVVELIG